MSYFWFLKQSSVKIYMYPSHWIGLLITEYRNMPRCVDYIWMTWQRQAFYGSLEFFNLESFDGIENCFIWH